VREGKLSLSQAGIRYRELVRKLPVYCIASPTVQPLRQKLPAPSISTNSGIQADTPVTPVKNHPGIKFVVNFASLIVN